jgi:hypothetical protein
MSQTPERRKRKAWNGKWFNTTKGRRELLVQYTTLLNQVDELRERIRFMQAITQKAVVELQKAGKR